MIWYARIDTTGGVHLHELPPAETEAQQQERSRLIGELRDSHGIPEDWVTHPDREANGWDVSVVVMPARATVHPLEAS